MTKKKEPVMVYFGNFIKWILSFFSKPKKVKRKKKRTPLEVTETQYTSIKVLLDDLDGVFELLNYVHIKSSDDQAMIKRFGFYLPDASNLGLTSDRLEGFKAYGLPSLIANYIDRRKQTNLDDVSEFFVANKSKNFGYFHKRKGFVYYSCTFLTKPKWAKELQEVSYYITVNKVTGEVSSLPLLYPVEHHIINKKGNQKKGIPNHSFTSKQWAHPCLWEGDLDQKGLKEQAEKVFIAHYNITMSREFGVNIIIKKGGKRLTITVPPDRWKYFFKDRISATGVNGQKLPIFHSVTSHTRKTKTGLSNVKTHYRGMRDFSWGGYKIKIVMQGKHAASQSRLDLTGEEFSKKNLPKGWVHITDKKTAEKINETFEG